MGKISLYLNTNPLLVDIETLSELVMSEIDPVRYLLDSNTDYQGATDSQLREFGIFMNKNILDYKNRIPILQAITGNPKYTSTSLMTFGVISVLIDTLVDVTHVQSKTDPHNEWEPSPWFREVVPGIEHLVIAEGGVCPPFFYRDGILETRY